MLGLSWEEILAVISVVGILGGIVAWFARLEAKVLLLEQRQVEDRGEARSDRAAIWEKLDAIQEIVVSMGNTVARIEGKLEK